MLPFRGNFDQVVLFVQTHSDKDRGDLMYSGDGHSPTSRSAGVSNVSGNHFQSTLPLCADYLRVFRCRHWSRTPHVHFGARVFPDGLGRLRLRRQSPQRLQGASAGFE